MSKIITEQWVILEEFPHYAISNYGRVAKINGGNPHILRQYTSNCGYRVVAIRDCSGEWRTVSVHRLVGTAFIPNPRGLPEINHLDEDKFNNKAPNLEWCTKKYNNNYGTRCKRIADGRMDGKNWMAKAIVIDGIFYGSKAGARRALKMAEGEFRRFLKDYPDRWRYATDAEKADHDHINKPDQ